MRGWLLGLGGVFGFRQAQFGANYRYLRGDGSGQMAGSGIDGEDLGGDNVGASLWGLLRLRHHMTSLGSRGGRLRKDLGWVPGGAREDKAEAREGGETSAEGSPGRGSARKGRPPAPLVGAGSSQATLPAPEN